MEPQVIHHVYSLHWSTSATLIGCAFIFVIFGWPHQTSIEGMVKKALREWQDQFKERMMADLVARMLGNGKE